MTKTETILDVSATISTLLKSMGIYVYHRLGSSNKEAYRLAMKECILIMECKYEDLDLIKSKISGVRQEATLLYPNKLFKSRQDERQAFEMAVDQALNIVLSLEARFITGQSDSEPRGYRNKGLLIRGDEGIF